ncbi:MAG: hypothetical protein PHU25_15715 [Deltaproteobacteria bacterium]|nr:hypothetical protein [Deltaproteobacteria bacterium]
MKTRRVMLVGLHPALDKIESMINSASTSFTLAADMDEALDLACLEPPDLMIVSKAIADLDPVEVVARFYGRVGPRPVPFVFVGSADLDGVMVVRRPIAGEGFAVDRFEGGRVADVLCAFIVPDGKLPPAIGDVDARDSLARIGFSEKVEALGRFFLVQTEVQVSDRPQVRCAVFDRGRIVAVRTAALRAATDPIADARELARQVHDEVVDEVKRSIETFARPG